MSAVELVATGTPTTLEQTGASWLAGYTNPRTRGAYERDLRDWLRFCHDNHIDPYTAIRGHVDGWILWQQQQGAAASSIHRRHAAIKGWYDHLLHDLDLIVKNPAARVKPPRVHTPSKVPMLDLATIAGMAQAARADGPDLELAFWLMFANGLRITEVTMGISTADVARAPNGDLYGMVRGKGGKTRMALFTHRGAELVEARCFPIMVRQSTVPDRRLVRSGVRTIQRRIAAWGEQAGAAVHVHPHVLRHMAGTILQGPLAPGVKLQWVQDFLGHADPRTTRAYDRGRGLLEHNPARVLGELLTDATNTVERTQP